ncbi:hypothetical protein [Serratia sp. (in: enterobacteria)]|uniref:hypothetical protein n=1 Tax=Serratia sp. (in: enterobacteria) TaxID=616 RepID=UPI0039892C0F
MKPSANLPTYATGLQQVLTALRATPAPHGISSEDFKWKSRDAIQQHSNNLISLRGSGYSLSDYEDSILEMTSFKGPFKVLTHAGEILLREACLKLEGYSRNSRFIISKRIRAADRYSKFIHDMVRDRNFLLNLSKIAQFWHVAGDDGIPATLNNWGAFQTTKKVASTDYAAIDCAPITWEDLG